MRSIGNRINTSVSIGYGFTLNNGRKIALQLVKHIDQIWRHRLILLLSLGWSQILLWIEMHRSCLVALKLLRRRYICLQLSLLLLLPTLRLGLLKLRFRRQNGCLLLLLHQQSLKLRKCRLSINSALVT